MALNTNGKKISSLTRTDKLNDADVLPFSSFLENGFETKGATLSGLRSLLYFDHAVENLAEGLEKTFSGQYFHVWRTAEKLWVDEYINVDGVAEVSRNNNGEQKSYPTPNAIIDAIKQTGRNPVDSFEDGNTLTNISQVLRWKENNSAFYSWQGSYPKVVPSGSTPETTGGFGPMAWVDVSDLTLRNDLLKQEGLKYIGRCPDINTLRTMRPSFVGQKVDVIEHSINKGVGGGFFVCTALSGGATIDDDNGYRIVSNGAIWDRHDPGHVYLDRFGVVGGDYIDDAIANALKSARRLSESDVWIPASSVSYKMHGDCNIDLSDGNPIFIRGMTSGHARVKIVHDGDNICFRFHKSFSSQRQFWADGGIENINIAGVNPTGTGVNTGVQACSIRFSDMWKATARNLFISGYSSGVGIHLYNETAWTEGTLIEDVMIRAVRTGIFFSRNSTTDASNTSTNSFFKTTIRNYSFNAGVTGVSSTAIRMGDAQSACFIYGSTIDLTMWMSAGSWHNGVLVDNKSSFVESDITLCADGYGISKDATVEVVHLLRVMTGGICRPHVNNISGQNNPFPISKMSIIRNSCFYTEISDGSSLGAKGLPIMNPTGLKMQFYQEFSIEEQLTGVQYVLNALPVGMRMLAVLRSWSVDDTPRIDKYEIQILGGNFQTKVIPDLPARVNHVSVSTTVISDTTVVTGVTAKKPENTFHEDYSLVTPRLSNMDANNNSAFSIGSGRQFRFVLPSNNLATSVIKCSLEITIL